MSFGSAPSYDYEGARRASLAEKEKAQAEANRIKAEQDAKNAAEDRRILNDAIDQANSNLAARNRRRRILINQDILDEEDDSTNPASLATRRRSLLED